MSESPSLAALATTLYEREILAAEGPYHVRGAYYANDSNADTQRQRAAERMVREAARPIPSTTTSTADGISRDARPNVSTWLTARERQRVDLAAGAHVVATHRESLAGVRADLIVGRADAALVSTALVSASDVSALASIVSGLPNCTVVGLIADSDEPHALAGTLRLGQAGVLQLVDARTPSGWEALRHAFAATLPNRFQRDAVAAIVGELTATPNGASAPADTAADLPRGCIRFFRAVFSPYITTAEQLADTLGMVPSTLMSRFYRAGLPAPKRYLITARLAWAAHLGESPARTVTAIALRLDASSPQSFGRMVRMQTGLTATQFRSSFTGAAMLERFCATLVRPYRETLRSFDPLTDRSGNKGRHSCATYAPHAAHAPQATAAAVAFAGRVA